MPKVIILTIEPALMDFRCECVDTIDLPMRGNISTAQVKKLNLEIIQPDLKTTIKKKLPKSSVVNLYLIKKIGTTSMLYTTLFKTLFSVILP